MEPRLEGDRTGSRCAFYRERLRPRNDFYTLGDFLKIKRFVTNILLRLLLGYALPLCVVLALNHHIWDNLKCRLHLNKYLLGTHYVPGTEWTLALQQQGGHGPHSAFW